MGRVGTVQWGREPRRICQIIAPLFRAPARPSAGSSKSYPRQRLRSVLGTINFGGQRKKII